MERSGHYYRQPSKASLPDIHRIQSTKEGSCHGPLNLSLLPQHLFTSQYEEEDDTEETDQYYYYYTVPPLSLVPVLKMEQPLKKCDLTER